MQTRKSIIAVSIALTAIFVLAQFTFGHGGTRGPWCSPVLGAAKELGHPTYQYVEYGFPFPIVDLLTNDCAEGHPLTYEWLPFGVGVNGFLLMLIASPIWRGFVKRKINSKD
jgi:hypothetical protein